MPIHHVAVAKVSKWLLVQAQASIFAYIKGRLSEQMGLSNPALSVPNAKLLLDDYLRRFEERLAQRIIDRLDEDRLVKLNSAISQLKMATRVPIDHRRGYLERALGNFFDIASLPEGTTAGFPNAQLRSLACLGIAAIHLGADEIVAENLAEAICIDLDTARTWFGEETIQTVLAAHPELGRPQQQTASPQQSQKEGLTPPRVLTPAIQQRANVSPTTPRMYGFSPPPGKSGKSYKSPPEMQIQKDRVYNVILETNRGNIRLALKPAEAPVTVNNFIILAWDGFYNGVTFHRVVPGVLIQSGDPTGTGYGGPGYTFADEPVRRPYRAGTVAMAKGGPNTNGSQFFICLENKSTLQPGSTIFGDVVSGMDVVRSIRKGDVINRVTLE